jgi:hypothetical protein
MEPWGTAQVLLNEDYLIFLCSIFFIRFVKYDSNQLKGTPRIPYNVLIYSVKQYDL